MGPHRAWDSWVYKRVLIKKLLRRMDPQEAATRMCDGGVFRVFFSVPRLLVSKVHSGSFLMLDSSCVNNTHCNDTTLWLHIDIVCQSNCRTRSKLYIELQWLLTVKVVEYLEPKQTPNFNLTAPKRLKDIMLIIG